MCSVDKRLLAEALKLKAEKPILLDFGFGADGQDKSILDSFQLTGDKTISVPVSLTDIKLLSKTSHSSTPDASVVPLLPTSQEKHLIEIEASKLGSFMPTSFLQNEISSLASTVVRRLGINPGVVSFEPHLHNLCIFPPGGFMKPTRVMETEPGMFAKMILQIPVEGGHSGGKLKMHRGGDSIGKMKPWVTERKTHPHFSFAAVLNGSELEVEPVADGWMVWLAFNLVWRNAFAMADPPCSLLVLMTSLNEIAEALRCWNAPTSYDPKLHDAADEASPEDIIASVLDGTTPSQRLDYSSEILNAKIKTSINRFSNNNNNMLFFLLEGTYGLADFGFADLVGQDQTWARLFICSQFLDVHLAVITQSVPNVPDYTDLKEGASWTRRLKVEHWINTSNTLIKLKGIALDVDTQLMGNVQKLKCLNVHEEANNNNNNNSIQRVLIRHYPVLVIWPKPQTIRIYCQYGFNAVLDRMEVALGMSSVHRQELVGDLGIILSFCRAEPARVWKDPTTEAGQRAYRLLGLCLFLRAKDEGLELLELLGTDFNMDPDKKRINNNNNNTPSVLISFEGVQSPRVARRIAEFQCLISDWSACCNRILAFVSPGRIVDQLMHLTHLVESFVNRCCFEAATELMDCMSFALLQLKPNMAAALKQPALDAYVDQVIAMETGAKSSNPQRLANLVALFPRLDIDQQCRLIVDLQADNFLRLPDVASCRQMYADLCRIVSNADFALTCPPRALIVPLLKSFLVLNEEPLVQSMVQKITATQDPASGRKGDWIEIVLESSDIWDSIPGSQLAGKMAAELVTTRLRHLIGLAEPPSASSVAVCVRQAFRLEREKALKDANLLPDLYAKLPLDHLFQLVLDLQALDGPLLRDDAGTHRHFVELCRIVVERSQEPIRQVPHRIVIEVMKTLIWLGDVTLVRALVKHICLAGSGGSWDPSDKIQLLEAILSSSDWRGPQSGRLVRDSCTALIGAWIVGLCRILDQVDPSGGGGGRQLLPDGLRHRIAKCVDVFMRTEKSQPRSDQPNITAFFSLLLAKLSTERLCHLILDLRKMDGRTERLKQPPCAAIFADLCRLLVVKDLSAFVKCYGWLATEVWKCLLWFDDGDASGAGQTVTMFTSKILDAFPPGQENPVVTKIVSSAELRQLAGTSPSARRAFTQFVRHRIDHLKSMTRPFLSWDHPHAVVPGHPEVEGFLRSTQKSTVHFLDFATFSAACKFSIEIGGTKNGYSVRVDPVKSGQSFKCKMEKLISRNALLKKEMDELAELVENLKRPAEKTGPATSSQDLKREAPSDNDDDDVVVINPPKRSRDEQIIVAFNAIDY